jgi:lipopolysaccharide transport protein LptA
MVAFFNIEARGVPAPGAPGAPAAPWAPGALALCALLAGTPVGAATRQPQAIVLDAQSADADLSNNNVLFRKVRITQGDMSIAADQGQGTQQKTRLDFNNSLWLFRGNVKIAMNGGLLTSDDAEISFAKQQLAKAVVNGKPAEFEQKVAKTGKVAQGRADSIDYDAASGMVRLLKNAWLSDGQTDMRGELLKYDVVNQVIRAEASEQNSQRVHIVITPPPAKP